MKVLSIDFDFFIEENPQFDIGHQETDLFLTSMWDIRRVSYSLEGKKIISKVIDLREKFPFRGCFDDILDIKCLFSGNYRIATAESHLAILKILSDMEDIELINIDAHHDLHYGRPAIKREECSCGNWGSYLIENGQVKSWTQIYPSWRKKYSENNKGIFAYARKKLGKKFKVQTGEPSKLISWEKVDIVFLCRSGCWVPPEYDLGFKELSILLGARGELPIRKIELPKIIKKISR